jgi:RES domain-containing protein
VAVDPLLTPWSGDAYRHVPAGLDVDVLDFRYAGQAGDNRWNVAGEPTLYLASDRGVVIAEFARHLSVNIVHGIEQRATVRQIYRLRIAVAHLLDLRDHRVLDALSIDNAPHCFLDPQLGRGTARAVRSTTAAQAMLVPSVAFLDDPERWVAMLFLEKLPPDPRQFIRAVEALGTFHLD